MCKQWIEELSPGSAGGLRGLYQVIIQYCWQSGNTATFPAEDLFIAAQINSDV